MVRPDGVDVLIQQEYEYSPSRYINWLDELQPYSWKRKGKGNELPAYDPKFSDQDRFFDVAECNVIMPFDKSEETEVEICNNAVGLVEAYVHTSNHELRNGDFSYESGRSRIYLVRSGPFQATLLSHDILDSGLPIRFGFFTDSKGFVTNRTSLIKYYSVMGSGVRRVGISILHGRNLSWYSYQKRKGSKKKDFTESIKKFFLYADSVVSDMKKWATETNSLYIVLLCKDHRARYPYMDYAEIYNKFGVKWNLLPPNVALSDTMDDPQWWETHGYRCSSEIRGDICVSHIDDHNPVLFEFTWMGTGIKRSEVRKMSDEYFIKSKSDLKATMIGYQDEQYSALDATIHQGGGDPIIP